MSLDVFQQVYSLSLLSNLVNDFKGTQESLQKALQLGLASTLPSIGSGWNLAWGPVVWKNKPDEATTGPDNSWYIAYHPNLEFEDGSVHPTYLIAIAGTPRESDYVWTKHNFGVNSVADFNVWVANGLYNLPEVVPVTQIVPGTPYIATGTVSAVHLLLTTPAPKGTISPGTTLLDFVANVDISDEERFIVTGHSLGGALSSSLALALVGAGVIPSQGTLTYPTAGPTPGNRFFTELFTATFPARKSGSARSYQGWNLNLVNTLDIVPQAWCIRADISPRQNLNNIPPIYGKPALPIVQGATLVFAVHTLRSGVIYYPLPSQYFSGPLPDTPTSLEGFLVNFGKQHELAYFDEVGIAIPTLDKSEVLRLGLVEKTADEKLLNYPVIAAFEWEHEHPKEAQKEIDEVENGEEAKTLADGV